MPILRMLPAHKVTRASCLACSKAPSATRLPMLITRSTTSISVRATPRLYIAMYKRGVARTEILVVLLVISMGSLVALGALEQARQDARVTLCAGNMRNIGIALLAYASSSQQTLPPECLRGIQDYTPAF